MMKVTKSQIAKHLSFWILFWLLQSVLFAGGKDLSFYLVKNIAIVLLQAVVVYINFYLVKRFLTKGKYPFYVISTLPMVYLVYAVSFDLIDLIFLPFFPNMLKIDSGLGWWPTGFWRIISGSAPYSLMLLSSTIFYLIKEHRKREVHSEATEEKLTSNEDGIILIKEGKTLHRINTAEVLYVEGLKEYVNWQTDDKRLITLHSLQKLEELLRNRGFLRTHKSFIINTNYVDTIKSTSVEISGRRIPIGRSYRQKVQEHFSVEDDQSIR